MKNFTLRAVALTVISCFMLSSCATIFTPSKYPVTFNSAPEGADVTITTEKGAVVYTGVTPMTVILNASNGYMKKGNYIVNFNKPGYKEYTYYLQASLDGWYVANILIGGLIGMLIVDPASGAMCKIKDRDVQVTMAAENGTNQALTIIDINDLPEDMKDKLELISQ